MPPRFHNPLVRDLAWVAASPALLDGQLLPVRDPLQDSIWRQDPDQLWHELSALDEAPHRLAELFSDSPDRRLGSHYERLWHALLTLAPDTRILAHNIALRRGAHTLGEIDLVMQAADGAIVHLGWRSSSTWAAPTCTTRNSTAVTRSTGGALIPATPWPQAGASDPASTAAQSAAARASHRPSRASAA
ncbi:DUF1853 family protein [Halopseudomonas pachastrellae]|nr:DUF1853 family protein [Halopseudomonas pachastrellae]